MPYFSYDTLINDNGELDRTVYRHVVRRREMNEYGALSPMAMREAISHYSAIIPILQRRKREALGLPATPEKLAPMMNTGWRPDGLSWEA